MNFALLTITIEFKHFPHLQEEINQIDPLDLVHSYALDISEVRVGCFTFDLIRFCRRSENAVFIQSERKVYRNFFSQSIDGEGRTS